MLIICNVHPINKIMLVDLSPYPYFEIAQIMLFLRQPWSKRLSKDSAYVICFLYCKIQQPNLNLVLI